MGHLRPAQRRKSLKARDENFISQGTLQASDSERRSSYDPSTHAIHSAHGRPAAAMITSAKCKERAAECRQMAEREQNFRVRSILIDMARTWERLALEAERAESERPLPLFS